MHVEYMAIRKELEMTELQKRKLSDCPSEKLEKMASKYYRYHKDPLSKPSNYEILLMGEESEMFVARAALEILIARTPEKEEEIFTKVTGKKHPSKFNLLQKLVHFATGYLPNAQN